MSYRLLGPFEFDEDAVVPSGREALSSVADAIKAGRPGGVLAPASGRLAGLYILASLDGEDVKQTKIVGFWVVLGRTYLAKGPAGAPDREPPIAKQLMEAATEEVWWKRLPVKQAKGVWTPLIVLEWPPMLAYRSAYAPPGMPDSDDGDNGPVSEEPERWLAASGTTVAIEFVDDEAEEVSELVARYAHLPEDRSLVAVIRGKFTHTRSLASGQYELLPVDMYGDGTDLLPFDEWVDVAQRGKVPTQTDDEKDAKDRIGRPLGLLSGAVGFPLSGWLTKGLDLWPPLASEVMIGKLTDREVQTKWVAQMRLAIGSTIAVLALVIGFSVAVRAAAEPRPRPVKAQPPPAAQPAMSVCSADHQKFVQEFRCQIAHLAAGGDDALGELACGDRGLPVGNTLPTTDNLQVAYCGLEDRQVDKWTASIRGSPPYNFAHVAAAQACFNVLGHPYPYQLSRGGTRVMGNPDAFLTDDALKIQPLVDLVGELEDRCETYRGRVEARVEGAVFATHIGSTIAGSGEAESEASKLRRIAVDVAMVGATPDTKECFRVGMDSGLDATSYAGICSPRGPDKVDSEFEKSSKIWVALKGDGSTPTGESLVSEYVSARFGASDGGTLPPLWECHLSLEGRASTSMSSQVGYWDIPIAIPSTYRIGGSGARSQLQLDSTILALRDGQGAGPCWDVVSGRLASYQPVHPLLAPLDDSGWPSAEQQLCGQVCAAAYRVSEPATTTPWVTPRSDLEMCVTTAEPRGRPEMGRGVLDRLRVPWSYDKKNEWVPPSAAQICAFNLVAQDRVPKDDATGFIVNNRSPEQWAGETASGSRIAGGTDGLVVIAVQDLARFQGIETCGDVALQCFSGLMLDVMGDPDFERYEWKSEWQKSVLGLARTERSSSVARDQPWCARIHRYLDPAVVDADLSQTCRYGVEQARAHVETALDLLATARGKGQ